MSALVSFFSALQSLATEPDTLTVRIYPDPVAQSPSHYPEWHVNFNDTGLYVYLGYGSVIFHSWNDIEREFLTVSTNSARRNGQIENGSIFYRVSQYRTQVQTLFNGYRNRPEAFLPIRDPLALVATIDGVSNLQIPLLLTDSNVVNNLSIVGELLPGRDHSELYGKIVVLEGQTCVRISDILTFVSSQSSSLPLVPEPVPEAVIVGIDSVVDIDSFFDAEPQQTTTYEDVHCAHTPDYIFELALPCTLQDIPQLLAPFAVTSYQVDGQHVGSRVMCGTEQFLVDSRSQVVQNPSSWDHWVFQQKLFDAATQQPVRDLFSSETFQSDLPDALFVWVSQKVEACLEGTGNLKSAQEELLQPNLTFTDTFKWISLREFQSTEQPEWQQYITQTLLPQFEQFKHRLRVPTPVLGTEAVRHAAWHVWAKSIEWLSHAPATPPARIHILNQAEFRYASGPVRKNILLRLM